jgi:methyl-accepting chemotaxis protein
VLTLSIITIVAKESKDALFSSQFEKLLAVNSTKTVEIENYFKILKGLLVSLANHDGTVEAFKDLDSGFYKLQSELNLNINELRNKLSSDFDSNYLNSVNYDVPNSASRKDTKNYIPKDNNAVLAQYIFITDNKHKLGEKNSLVYNEKYNSSYMKAHKKYHASFDKFLNEYALYDIFMVDLKGNLIYTDFKEKDFATNLKSGVYSNTGIAKAYKKALGLSKSQIAFEDFAPYEPSYNGFASFIATPIFDGDEKIGVLIFQMPVDKINEIMQFGGKYKEAGLGESGECYLVGQDYKMRSNSRFQKDIDDKVVQSLGSTIGAWKIDTKSSQLALQNKSGQHVITDYRDINVLSVYNTINLFGQTRWALLAEIDEDEVVGPIYDIIILIVSIVIVLFFVIAFVLYFVLKRVIDKNIVYAVNGISESTSQINSASGQLSAGAVSLADMSANQSASVEQISATIEQTSANVNINFDSMIELEQYGLDMENSANSGHEKMTQLHESMNEISNSSEQINTLVNTIDEIAFQTNLLALNAAVEAARAGEHGLGFAVVSEEVRNLATRSATESQKIHEVIEKAVEQSNRGIEISKQTGQSFEDIVDKIKSTMKLISQTTISSKEQKEAIEQLRRAIVGIEQGTQSLSASSEEIAASSEELNAQAHSTNDIVAHLNKLI